MDKRTNEDEIKQAISDLQEAILENIVAKKEVIEAEERQKKSHYKKQKAMERLFALERNL
jgi:hypothetical protein